MSIYPHLEHAPITEALIDIRIKQISDDDGSITKEMTEAIIEGYPSNDELRLRGIEIKFPAIETETQNIFAGQRFTSSDNKQVFQARLNGFTFSRLEPYLDWENLVSNAHKLWPQYLELMGNVQVIRIAVRYINRIEVPVKSKLDDYFVALPRRPEPVPDNLISFLNRTAVRFDEEGATALITQSMPKVEPDLASIIFDIDVFKETNYDSTSEDLWADLEKLRNIKNLVFFESLTSKAIDTYKD